MRGPRLTRSKTSDPAIGTSAARNYDSRSATVKTSFDDLRSPDGRQKLREQLSSQFPESYASSLKSSPSATDMAGGQWLGVGQNAAAKSSSSSIESAGNGKRLSTVPEKNQAAIDVEQAINLLTELKKTATPEQLVALHKALLPTRDSIVSTADSSAGQRASLIRQKSMLPAGLATRGGASDDLLKRQEDVEPTIRKKKSGKLDGHKRLQSKSSIAALDLADEAANPLPAQRAATPNDQHYFGAYRPGTLRITNGAASPEPSLRPRTSGEGAGIAVSTDHAFVGRNRAGSLAKALSQGLPTNEPAVDIPKQCQQSTGGEFKAAIPAPKSRDPSQSRQYKPKRSQEAINSGSTTPVARSREPSLSRQPLQVETKASKQSMTASKKASTDSFMRRSLDISRQSIDSIRHSIDDGRVSPIDAPRFVQRWSHRASQISQDHQSECDVPVSPFDDRQQAASSFAQRLSTVYDGGDAENTANETPEAALNILEGNTRDREERNSLKATAATLNAVRPKPVTYHSEPRPMPTKADSGYVSDASHRSVPWQAPHDLGNQHTESPATYEHSQPGYKEIVHKPEPDVDDIQSLYTLEQVLKMPNILSAPSTPRPEAARKHSSLLKLTGLKKSGAAASKTTLDPHSSADSLPLPNELGGSSPAESKSPKPGKKLQKKMPEEVRKQRKAQREKAKQSSSSLAGQNLDAMDMPTDVSELASSPVPGSGFATPSATTAPNSPLAARKESTPAEALSELVGDSQQPAELDTDESASAPKRSLSRKQSRKSRRRSRQSTITAEDGEGKSEGKARRPFSLGRKRSKSKRRSGSLTPKRNSQGKPEVPSIAALSATWDENGSQDSLPLYSDTGSVARTLGSNPYDISTGMFGHGGRNRGPVLDQLQSPHQISTSFSRTRTGGLQGMDSAMASELARAKSRDVAIQNNESMYDRPRMATPNKRSQTDMMPPRAKSMMPNAVMVEQRVPGWNAKPVFQKNSFESLDSASRQRPHSIAESIPSLPELPVDTEQRSAKAAEYLARRNRQMQTSPVLAESPTPSSSPDPSASEHAGFSNESVADAVAKAVEARRARHAERVKLGQQGDRLRPAGPRMNSNESGSSGKVSLQLHGPGVDERPYSDASASIVIGVGSPREEKEEGRPSTAPAPAPMENDSGELTVWERQAQMWREKRESDGKPPSNAVEDEKEVNSDEQSAQPPAVLASRHSGLDSLPSAQRRRKSASEHANAYRDLIGPDSSFDEPLPNPNRASTQTTSTVTTTTTTIGNRSSTDTVVVEDARPAKAYHQAKLIHRDRSPGGRVRTPSGSYHPYSPDHAASAERSRASLAQLEGKDGRATQSLDIQRRFPGHQQQDTLESILGRYDRTLSPVPASDAGSVVDAPGRLETAPRSGPSPTVKEQQGPMVDRYGGGLQYGYERGVGVQGSSGLRGGRMDKRTRDGNQFSERFGLDFGDVPVFLRRA